MSEPEVSVPAVMRNYHEVLRNDLARVLTPLAHAGDVAAFAAAWSDYRRAIAVHAAMEDGVDGAGGGITAMLDRYFDGATCATVFRAEHVDEHAAQDRVTAAVRDGDVHRLQDAWTAYRAFAEAHLKHEEDVMMPLVARLPLPKAPKFAAWCMSAGVATGDFDHFVAHGVRSLSAFGSGRNTPVGASRVWLQSLKSVSDPAQWRRYLPIARAAASPDVWTAILSEVPSLEGDAVVTA